MLTKSPDSVYMSRARHVQEGPGMASVRRHDQQPRYVHINGMIWLHHQLHTTAPPPNSTSLYMSLPEDKNEMLLTNRETEERRIAVMGRPILGEHVKLKVTIEESYEFKVSSGK